jgi:hypothetical protein
LYFFNFYLKNSISFSGWNPRYKKNNNISYNENPNTNIIINSISSKYINNTFYNHECILPIKNTINKNIALEFSGNDGTYIEKEEQLQIINNIKQNFYKLNLLKILTNENISDINKLKLIDQYIVFHYPNKMINNIYAGGLFNDWDYE